MGKSIFIPIADNGMGLCRTHYVMSLVELLSSKVLQGWDVVFESISFPYPDGSANMSSNDFLCTKCDWLLYIDTDIAFRARDVAMLLEHDEPLVAGLYPLKKRGLIWPMIALTENPRPFDKHDQVLCEVACVARGFTKIHRSVFEALKEKVAVFASHETDGRPGYEFWRNLPGGHSDDFNFCNLYRETGGKVFVDQRILVKHVGNVLYPIEGTFNA